MKRVVRISLGFWISVWSLGCSSLWSDSKPQNQKADAPAIAMKAEAIKEEAGSEEMVRFSENPNIGAFNERRYRRTTRKSIEEDSEVGSRAGSLWNTEGPSAYLFAQNKLHREGDLLNVKLEGNAKTQIDTKIQVIKKLLSRIEIVPTPPSVESPNGNDAASVPPRGPASAPVSKSTPGVANPGSNSTPESSEGEPPISIEVIPTRVTERLSDGSYRVKGQQAFLIGKKEFRVILTGLVRPEDYSDEGINSSKLLDPQLDVVSQRRSLK